MVLHDLLLGFAIGDAFGAGVEFQDRRWIAANLDFRSFINARDRIPQTQVAPELFTEHYRPWDYTDDTEMLLGVIRALCSGQSPDPEVIYAGIAAEYADGVKHKGYGRNGHGSLRWVFSGEKSLAEVRQFQATRPHPGNGAAVRAVPLGLLPPGQITAWALANANATHPHPKAHVSSLAIAWASFYLLSLRGEPAGLIDFCREKVLGINGASDRLLERVASLPAPDDLAPSDYAVLCGPQPIPAPFFPVGIYGLPSDAMHTTGSLLYLLAHARTAFGALQMAVRIGGDVDSLAAVATGIWAARAGIGSLPAYMRTSVEGQEHLRKVAEQWESWRDRQT
ncbi:MAG: ADP-ribosylglycohydrolase family protein [Bacteroidota bacterium]